MNDSRQYSFPIKDTILHVALIGVFAMIIAVMVFVPDLLGIAT